MPQETQVVAALEQNKYYTHKDLFYVNRHSFWEAGQDSWTLPPAQNQDMFTQLINVEPVLQGVLQRRRGYTLFNGTFAGQAPFTRAYSFRSESKNLRELVFSSTTNVAALDETGAVILNSIFTPSTGATAPRMVLSRDFGYFADGAAADYKKWDGTSTTGNLTNWGISAGAGVTANKFGPQSAGGVANVNVGTNLPWSNQSNVLGPPDGAFSTNTFTNNAASANGSDRLQTTSYGFSIPNNAGPVNGIVVTIKGFTDVSLTPVEDIYVSLMKNGIRTGSVNRANLPVGSNGFVTFGSPQDLWGSSWSLTDINAANFGVSFSTLNYKIPAQTATFSIDSVQVTVYTSGTGLQFTTNTNTTNIVLNSGRTYFYAFQNSQTGHTSDLSPASANTGSLTGSEVDITGIPTSADPQVDKVVLLATADGGDQTFLFFLGSVPNGTPTFTDQTAEVDLLTHNVYQETDEFGFLHGIANNKVPPTGTFPVKHKGRLYMAQGHTLFFSKNLDEVVTSTGLTTGKWEEAWPSTNQIDISTRAETVQGLLSDGETLWIGTERAIRRLIGDSPRNFQEPEIQFNETGVLNQEVWQVVFYEGQPVGTMWLTPDFRVMASDFNSYQDVGMPIQDVLNSINPSAIQNCHASFVSQGPADYYILWLPIGGPLTVTPTTACVFNLRSKKWFIWNPTDFASSSLFNINASGVPQWLFTTAIGNIYFWDNNTLFDRNGLSNLPFPAIIQTSWLDMGDYNIRKFVNQIIPTTADQTGLTIKVDGASNELDFNSPLSVVPATTVVPASIPTDVFVPLASGPSHNRAFQFTFTSPASTVKNILTGFAIEAGQFHKYVWWFVLGSGSLHLLYTSVRLLG